jgi:hypothetical protein
MNEAMKETRQKTLTQYDLAQFTGDLERYKSINSRVIYTPGVKFVAEKAGAYWLIDAIASYFLGDEAYEDERLESLQFWRLDVDSDCSATLSGRADSGVPPYVVQKIPYTDSPLESVDVWAGFDEKHWTLYLPSEH